MSDRPAWANSLEYMGECTHEGAVHCEAVGEHLEQISHSYGIRINGLATCTFRCAGVRCDATQYDSQWGAGLFNDWPRGHHKGYGA
jgi:hypothetical protein